jgi:hypothetical protein
LSNYFQKGIIEEAEIEKEGFMELLQTKDIHGQTPLHFAVRN